MCGICQLRQLRVTNQIAPSQSNLTMISLSGYGPIRNSILVVGSNFDSNPDFDANPDLDYKQLNF